jgi:hypothetical protein
MIKDKLQPLIQLLSRRNIPIQPYLLPMILIHPIPPLSIRRNRTHVCLQLTTSTQQTLHPLPRSNLILVFHLLVILIRVQPLLLHMLKESQTQFAHLPAALSTTKDKLQPHNQ